MMPGRAGLPVPAQPPTITLMLKRILDIVGSALGLVVLTPLFVVIAIAIRMETKGPAFFRQRRVGREGSTFRIYKFRSMHVGGTGSGPALTVHADTRITRVGAFLRKTKIDELPQLINVLAGDMSLVGPRPEVPEFMRFYSPKQRAIILSMRPGITDYAAILFRDESSLLDGSRDPVGVYRDQIMPIKFVYYERYSRNISVMNDLRIILATVLTLMLRRVPHWLNSETSVGKGTRDLSDSARPSP